MTRSHKIGWLVLAVTLLFVLWRLPRLHGQGFGSFSHDQPFLAKDATAGSSEPGTNIIWGITNLFRWWVASDVQSGAVISNQWTDRIVGDVLGQGDSSKRPTNSADGVYFDGTTFLTNLPLNWGDTDGERPIILLVAKIGTDGSERYLFSDTNGYQRMYFQTTGVIRMYDGVNGPLTMGTAWQSTPAWKDFMLHEMSTYTNGVLLRLNSSYNIDAPVMWQWFGAQFGGTNCLVGYVKELIVWTNTDIARPIDANILSNIHYYVTNRHQFSP